MKNSFHRQRKEIIILILSIIILTFGTILTSYIVNNVKSLDDRSRAAYITPASTLYSPTPPSYITPVSSLSPSPLPIYKAYPQITDYLPGLSSPNLYSCNEANRLNANFPNLNGGKLILYGKNFNNVKGKICFSSGNKTDCINTFIILSWTDQNISAKLSTNASLVGCGKIYIVNSNNQTSDAISFSVENTKITSIQPKSAFPGNTIVIYGSNFGNIKKAICYIKDNYRNCSSTGYYQTELFNVNYWSNNKITATLKNPIPGLYPENGSIAVIGAGLWDPESNYYPFSITKDLSPTNSFVITPAPR